MTRIPTGETWIVLQCPSSKTIQLVEALQVRGIHAWTPVWNRMRRMPRSHQTRSIVLPCIAGLVFAPSVQETPVRYFMKRLKVFDYRVMQTEAGSRLIPDDALTHLRKISDQPKEVRRTPLPIPGERMRFNAGAFDGLHCVVLAADNRFVTVELEEFSTQPVKINPFILERIAA